MKTDRPLVFDLHRFALDDGPGIRTTVFLKGCPLRCSWCHNPESMACGPTLAFYPQRCVGCGQCATDCPADAIRFGHPGRVATSRCDCCGRCAESCPGLALELSGRHYPPAELVEKLLTDRVFYETSHGGVTFSGGEPTMHPDYLAEVLDLLKAQAIHICLETCGAFDLGPVRQLLLDKLDLIFFDLKLADADLHQHHTGQPNDQIIDNFLALARLAPGRVVPRTPLIPGITDTPANLEGIKRLVGQAGLPELIRLPYNPLGREKRRYIKKSLPH